MFAIARASFPVMAILFSIYYIRSNITSSRSERKKKQKIGAQTSAKAAATPIQVPTLM